MSGRPSLALLKEQVGAMEGCKDLDYFRVSSYPRGIPKGALVELTGTAKISWLAHFLSENKDTRTLWIETVLTVFPTGLFQRGANHASVYFAQAGDELLKGLRIALQKKAYHCVVSPFAFEDERDLKRLQLLTEKNQATLFLISKEKSSYWQISTQLEIHPGEDEGSFSIETLKYKRSGLNAGLNGGFNES